MNPHPYRNHRSQRPTARWATILQTLLVAAIVAGLTVAFTLELSK